MTSRGSLIHELGRSGSLTFLFLSALAVVVTVLFNAIRPPTVEEVARDLWQHWARTTVDSQGENIVGLVRAGRVAACEQLLREFGQTIDSYGEDFVLRTKVRLVRVRDQTGNVFAEWSASSPPSAADEQWTSIALPLSDPGTEPSGTLEVTYRFVDYELENLPTIRRLAWLHTSAGGLVAILAIVMLVAAIANLQRLRERAGRLQSQQITLDLARQMCHELRNGLWAFSLEGRNMQQLFQMIDDYFREQPAALATAAGRVGLSEKDLERMSRQLKRLLADRHLDPETDLLAANSMARDAQQQIEGFSRYINLTVEQLDRNLLGRDTAWEPTSVRVRDAWRESCDLLALRLRSAGVVTREEIRSEDDWVWVDQRALVHVFVNLTKNAIEAMRDEHAERVLTFRVATTGSGDGRLVEVAVHNVGPPVPAHLIPSIFDRGFSTKSGAGRGIGLALVKESVARMSGSIRVESDPAGTTFHLCLPYEAPHDASPVARAKDWETSQNESRSDAPA